MPGATWHKGHAGALQWTTNLWESFGDFSLEPREFIHAGRGRFVCVTATLGQGRRSGLQLRLTAYAVVTVEGDKIRRIAITADREAALEAAAGSLGAFPPPSSVVSSEERPLATRGPLLVCGTKDGPPLQAALHGKRLSGLVAP
jgi:hypothetical protein